MTWRRRRAVTVLFFAAVLLAVASLSLTIGQIAVPIPDVLAITARRLGFPLASAENVSAMQEAVVWQIRMPRTLVGLLVGAALGISGFIGSASFFLQTEAKQRNQSIRANRDQDNRGARG